MQIKIAKWGFAYQLASLLEKTVHGRQWQQPAYKRMLGLVQITRISSCFSKYSSLKRPRLANSIFYFVKPKRKKIMKRINVMSNISKATNSIKCILILPKLFELP